jgi:DNA-binding NarL/FixJ family response regulator
VIRVLLVDDQQLVRAGLRRILAHRERFEVIGECADGSEVVEEAAASRPDVVIMDARMKNVGGAEATRRLRADPDAPPVLVLTTFDDDEVLSASLRAGPPASSSKTPRARTSSGRRAPSPRAEPGWTRR